MLFVITVIFLAGASALKLDVDLGDLPMQNPDLFEGDIIGIDSVDDKNINPNTQRRWTNRIIPYVIDSSIAKYRKLISEAFKDFHTNTCLKFKQRTIEKNYIRMFAGDGCYSKVGMHEIGEQPLSLGRGCMFKGTIVHELGHAIGFFHEHSRSDRDLYIVIYWQNIREGKSSQFRLLKPHQNMLFNAFDYNSIMLYSNTAFSKDRKSSTIVAKTGQKLSGASKKSGLSASDIKRIKQMYKCKI